MKLYRFEKATQQRCETLRERRFWAASPVTFNDLHDCRLQIDRAASTNSSEVVRVAYDQLSANLNEPNGYLRKISEYALKQMESEEARSKGLRFEIEHAMDMDWLILKRIIDHNRVVCFFADLLENPLMWAHYGDNHSGFAVEYEIGDDADELHEVEYSTKLPKLSLEELIFCPEKGVNRVLTTKTHDWAYEREYRIIRATSQKDGKGLLIDFPDWLKPTAVIMGNRLNNATGDCSYTHVSNVAASLKVPLLKMDLDNGAFQKKVLHKEWKGPTIL